MTNVQAPMTKNVSMAQVPECVSLILVNVRNVLEKLF